MTALRSLASVAVLAALATLGPCACWVTKENGKQMQADIVALQTEFEVVKQAHAREKDELAKRLEEADKQIAELKLLVDEYRRVTGRNAADFGVEIEQVKRHLTEMRGQVEVNSHRLGVIEKKLSIIHEDLSSQRAEAQRIQEERLKREEDEARKAAEEAAKPLPDIKRPEKKEDFYKLALSLLDAGQIKPARILFNEFLTKWPSDAYSDNALYWIGESYYAEKDYRKAALTFQRVRKEFSRGDKVADALLKVGYCFYEMKMYREALPFLKEFVQTYPRNPLAKKAKQKIREAQKRVK